MGIIMATIKAFTNLSQSKTLSKILPLESADMRYGHIAPYEFSDRMYDGGYDKVPYPKDFLKLCADFCEEDIYDGSLPCWSLASLLEQLPYELCDDDGNSSYLQIDKEDDIYQLVYTDPYGDFESIETDRYEHFIDACYQLILQLNELNLL